MTVRVGLPANLRPSRMFWISVFFQIAVAKCRDVGALVISAANMKSCHPCGVLVDLGSLSSSIIMPPLRGWEKPLRYAYSYHHVTPAGLAEVRGRRFPYLRVTLAALGLKAD